MDRYEKYISLAKQLGMANIMLITPSDIFFDIRANLKCGWGCDRKSSSNIKCDSRGTTLEERIQMIKRYSAVLLMHCHDETQLSRAILDMERTAFLDGYYFAFAVRACHFCKECQVLNDKDCPFPQKIRPCDSVFGIDVYKTVRALGLPCNVLQAKDDTQNRYGFLLIE